jgi:hypothetical protein
MIRNIFLTQRISKSITSYVRKLQIRYIKVQATPNERPQIPYRISGSRDLYFGNSKCWMVVVFDAFGRIWYGTTTGVVDAFLENQS